jgi:hypothetical protein
LLPCQVQLKLVVAEEVLALQVQLVATNQVLSPTLKQAA